MVPIPHQSQMRPTPSRLGCWWRLWVAFSLWWVILALILATVMGGWENGFFTVLLAIVSYPAIFLAIGLTIAWVRKGKAAQ